MYKKDILNGVSVLTGKQAARNNGRAARQESNPQPATFHTANIIDNNKNKQQ